MIQSGIGKCFVILTSRPEHDSKDKSTPFVSSSIRNAVNGEVRIEGFSPENIQKFTVKFLESEDKSKEKWGG